MKKTVLIKFLLLFFLPINNAEGDMFLGEFVDHENDTPVTSQAALRQPQSLTIADFVIYGKTADQNHKGLQSGLILICLDTFSTPSKNTRL